MICGAAREGLCLVTDTLSIEFAFIRKTKIESAFGCAEWDLSSGYGCVIFFQSDSAACLVHSLDCISPNKMSIVLDWINACVALLSIHETFVRADRLRLGCVSFVHCSNIFN